MGVTGVISLFFLFLGNALAQTEKSVGIDHFLGLNDTDSPAIIHDAEAQDVLNVESNLTGTAILKRKGFTREASLTITTSPINGSHAFIDANGNLLTIVCHDHYCAKSTNGAAFSNFLSTAGGAALPTRWSFVDIGGKLYGANDGRDPILQYDGTTLSYPAGMPAGSILELSKDRLIISDTSANPNRISYSQRGTYTNFTIGVNSVDPYNDDIGSSGDRVTGLKFYNNKLFIFKKQSITECILGDQYTSRCNLLTNAIGTNDPLAIVPGPGGLYFRGSDLNYWKYSDAAGFEIISKKISNLVKSQTSGSVRSNTQTSQTDWNNGTQLPSGTWNSTTTVGSIFPSSVTRIDTSSADFAAGTLGSSITVTTTLGQIQITSGTYPVLNGTFETGTLAYWGYWLQQPGADTVTVNTTGARDGTYGAQVLINCGAGPPVFLVSILDGGTTVYQLNYNTTPTIVNGGYTIDLAAQNLSTRTLSITFQASANNTNTATLYSTTFTAISSISWISAAGSNCPGNAGWNKLDNIKVNRYLDQSSSSQTYIFFSRLFDTTFSTSIGGTFTVSSTTPTGTSLSYQVRSATSSTGAWTSWNNQTNLNRITEVKEFYQYLSSFTTNVGTQTPSIQDVSLIAATTGQFNTQCIQPNPSISAWGLLSCSETKSGGGSLSYYSRADNACSYLSTNSWVSQSNNSNISVSTGQAISIRFDSLLTSGTDQAQIDACTIYWNEGTVAPPVSGTYESIKNAIYWGTAINNSTTNNRILKYDLNLDQWYLFDLTATALKVINGNLYFGLSSGGYWNRYATGGVDTDNGTAINAYWKSKDFGGDDPFVEKRWQKISVIARNAGTGSLAATYTVSNSSSSSYTISLTTSSSINYIRSNYYLGQLSGNNFFNLKLGNNAGSQPFEILGLRFDYTEYPWRVLNP